jgi:hypothetical protein
VSYASFAQAKGPRFGLKIGGNRSNVYDTEGQQFEASPKFGLAAGVFLSLPIGKYIGFQPEFLFSQKGFKARGTALGMPYSLTRTTNYIDVPLLFAIRPAPALTLLAGPQFSFLMSQNDVFTNSLLTSAQEQQFKNNNLRKNTLCFTGGLDVNAGNFVFGARVGWDLMQNNGDGTSTNPRYKNTWLQGTVGIRF